jgi:hypothetical protein
MPTMVFWVVTPCGLVGRHQRLGGTNRRYVRFEVLTAASMKMAVFRVLAP